MSPRSASPVDEQHITLGMRLLAVDRIDGTLAYLGDAAQPPPPRTGRSSFHLGDVVALPDARLLVTGTLMLDGQPWSGAAVLNAEDLTLIQQVSLAPTSYSIEQHAGGDVWIVPLGNSDPLYKMTDGAIAQVRAVACDSRDCYGVVGILPSGEIACRDDFWKSNAVLVGGRKIKLPHTLNTGRSNILLGEVLGYSTQRGVAWINLTTERSGYFPTNGVPWLVRIADDPEALLACTDRGDIAIIRLSGDGAVLRAINK